MLKLSFKTVYFICFIVACGLIAFAAYLQFWLGMQISCSITYVERIIMLFLGIVFLIVALYTHTPLSRRLWRWFALLISLLGAVAAGRHGWLQRFPIAESGTSQQPATSSFLQSLKDMFSSSVCAQAQWSWYGLSLADWAFVFFVLFAIICFWQQNRE